MPTPFETSKPRGGRSFYDFSYDKPLVPEDVSPIGSESSSASSSASSALPSVKGSSSSSSSTTTSVSSPYAQFKGGNYKDLEDFLRGQLAAYKPETKDEREKRERREKRVGFLARLADGLGTFHTAFSHARGIKAMEMPKFSSKVMELFEKSKSERDKNNDRLMNYAIALGNLKDKERDFNFRVTQAEQQQQNWQRQFDASRKDRGDDVGFREKQFDASRKDRGDDVGFREKQFEEGKRQFDVSTKEHERHNRASEGLQSASIAEQRRHNKANESLEGQRIAASQDGKYTEFMLDDGSMIRVPNQRLNSQNVSWVAKQAGIPTTTTTVKLDGTSVVTPRSSEELMMDIGQNLSNPNVRTSLMQLGGKSPSNGKGSFSSFSIH